MSDYRTTVGEAPPMTRSDRRKSRWRTIALTVLLVAILAILGLRVRVNRYVCVAGYVVSEEYAEVRPPVAGVVEDILVFSGDTVTQEQVLVRLERSELAAARAEAAARVRTMAARFVRLKAQIAEDDRQHSGQVRIASLRRQHAIAKLALVEELAKKGLAADTALEDLKLAEKVARAELSALEERDAKLPGKGLSVLERELEESEQFLVRADARLRAREITAPISGEVLRYGFVRGEFVSPDDVLYEVFGGSRQILKVRIPERHALLVKQEQICEARLTVFDNQSDGPVFVGVVETLRHVIQTENRQTYRVATCSFDSTGYDIPDGASVEAVIRVGRTSLWKSILGIY